MNKFKKFNELSELSINLTKVSCMELEQDFERNIVNQVLSWSSRSSSLPVLSRFHSNLFWFELIWLSRDVIGLELKY